MTLSRRRADVASTLPQDAGCGVGRFNLAHEDRSTIAGDCRSVLVPSESSDVLRVVFTTPNLCGAETCTSRAIAFLAFGFGEAASP